MDAHRQWASRPPDQRFTNLKELAESVQARQKLSRSTTLDVSDIEVSTDGSGIFVNGRVTKSEPTHWSFGQLSVAADAPANYLRKLPVELAVANLKHGIANAERSQHKFLTLEQPEQEDGIVTLQAVTSPTYGRIWDAEVVQAVTQVVDRSGGRFYNPSAYCTTGGFAGITGAVAPSGLYASDRDVFIFMIDGGSLLDAGPRAQLNRGFIVWNSEVGSKTFGMKMFLFNQVCGNHIIWGASNIIQIVIRHTVNGPARFALEAGPKLLEYANESAAPVETSVRKAQDYLLPEGKDEILEFANKHSKFTRGEIARGIDFAKSEEGDVRTLWNLVQGLTAYARGFDHVDTRVDLETRAGKLLNLVA